MAKFLLDMPLSPKVADWLRSLGHEAVHARSIGLDRASDREILLRAIPEGRIVITTDLDFPTILSLEKVTAPSVILIRMRDPRRLLIQKRLEELFRSHPEFQDSATITVIEDSRIRIRKLPIL